LSRNIGKKLPFYVVLIPKHRGSHLHLGGSLKPYNILKFFRTHSWSHIDIQNWNAKPLVLLKAIF